MKTRAVSELGQTRRVAANDNGAGLAHELHELNERGLDLFEGAVVIQVIGFDVGNDHDIGIEIQKGAIGLVGLAYKVLARAVATVGVVTLDDTADQEAGVEAHAIEHGGAHGRRGRLAMGSRNGDRRMAMSQSGEHLCARPNGNAELASADQLGVRLGDSGGDNHHVGLHLVDGFGLVADMNIDTSTRELANIARGLKIGTRHNIAALMQNEGDTAHAGAANPDKVGALERRLARCILDICHRSIYSLQRINNLQPVYCTATLPDRPKRCVICAIPLRHRQGSQRPDPAQDRVRHRASSYGGQNHPAAQGRYTRNPRHRCRRRRT